MKKARKKAPSDTGEETRKDQAASQKESRQIKEQIKEQIKAQEERVKDYSDKELEIIEGLNEIDYALNRARIKVSQLSAEIKTLEDKIIRLSTQKEELKTIIAQNRDYTGQRLKALYKMNMIGRLDAAGMPSSVFDFFLRQNAMKRIIQTDFDILEKQNTDFETLKRLEASLKVEKAAKTGLESELTDQIRINKSETLKKELILKEIRKKKKLSLAAVDALRDAEIRLETRIKRLQAGDTSPDQGLSFSSYKGRLKAPAQGRIISRFGPSKSGDDKSFTFQTGIDIKVERGEPVKSVFKGEVIFAEWLKGYGNVLIINHGDHYYTLYAHLEELFKRQGETVETGEVIATAGDTGSIKGTCLHFEVRHYGKPVNPLKWLNKGA